MGSSGERLLNGIFLLLLIAITGCESINQLDNDKQPLGEWQVTEITGTITNERTGGGVENLCDYFLETYNPIIDDDQTFILFQSRDNEPDFQGVTHEVFDTLNVINEGGVFIFRFSFDNGYLSNEVLDGSGLQYQYSDFIPGTYTFAIGVWTEDGVQGEIQTGTSDGGLNKFGVRGLFVSEDRIEGQWMWEEITAWSVLPAECTSEAIGSGNWVAVKK